MTREGRARQCQSAVRGRRKRCISEEEEGALLVLLLFFIFQLWDKIED
jgi:hypothetical protein